jgi:hypothetical protein
MFLESEVNAKFNTFMDTFLYYFDTVFPLKAVQWREPQRKCWVTQGIKTSSRRMRWLNGLEKKITNARENQAYISKY